MSEARQTERLGDICYIKARIGWRGLSSSEYTEDGPYLIAGQHIRGGQIIWDKCDHITEQRYLESHEIILRFGDVIITKDGTIGRVARIDDLPGDATINGTMMLLRPLRRLDFRYLYHILNGRDFQKLIDDKVSGSSIPHLFQRDMVELKVELPSRDHQSKIAEILDTLDTAIRGTEAVVAKLKAIKQGLLHDLLTRGIDANGDLRPLQSEAPHLYKQTPLGWLPKEWDVCAMQDLLAFVDPAMRSGPFGSALLKEELVSKGIPFLGIDNVFVERFDRNYKRFVTPGKFLQLHRYAVRPDDLMITIMGTVGRCCLVPDDVGEALSSKHTWTISLDQARYSPYLAMLQVNYSDWVLRHFSKDQQGGTMSAIRSETIRSTQLPMPPRDEQESIEAILSELSVRLSEEETILQKYRLQKSGLMDDLLTGRTSVTPLL
ncbi:restriction endonuclease subunit S [Gluconobacter sp. Dm-73]|uniref:restriction endonuclease subunit S n=1 Tax=Gluconobacter sp. Dm-73 TaxID=2799802 RepID=UPI001B8C35D2|nr:restriction endonuclease subunit S [Gluconobacter sp. Dm-73]MBS1074706.1 restriction endonuclease subunit S [Gluconobacter sp. Dm-73]